MTGEGALDSQDAVAVLRAPTKHVHLQHYRWINKPLIVIMYYQIWCKTRCRITYNVPLSSPKVVQVVKIIHNPWAPATMWLRNHQVALFIPKEVLWEIRATDARFVLGHVQMFIYDFLL